MTQFTTPPDTVTVLREALTEIKGMASNGKHAEYIIFKAHEALIATERAAIQPAGDGIVKDWPYCNPGCDYEDPNGGQHDGRSVHCSCEAAKASIGRQRAAPVCTPVQAAPGDIDPSAEWTPKKMAELDEVIEAFEAAVQAVPVDETMRLAQQCVEALATRKPMTADERKQWAHDLATSPTGTNDAEIRAALAATEVKQDASALPPLPEPEYDYYEIKGYDEGQMHAYVLADRAARQPSAVDLLAAVFDAWENGDDCYEEGDVDGSYMGKAFRLDDDVYAQCCDLLNRANPPRNASAYSDHDARVLKLALENLLSNSMPMPMMSAKEFDAAAVAHREATAKAHAALDALAARSPVAAPTEAPDSTRDATWCCVGQIRTDIDRINAVWFGESLAHGTNLYVKSTAAPESAEPSAGKLAAAILALPRYADVMDSDGKFSLEYAPNHENQLVYVDSIEYILREMKLENKND